MDIAGIVVLVLAVGLALTVITGQPLLLLVALIVGALLANRRGYRHGAVAIRRELAPSLEARTVSERLAELEQLRAEGIITEAEATERRRALIQEV